MDALAGIEELRQRELLPIRLLFDTADQPERPGVRSGEANSRHLLYQAASMCLDLRLERDARRSRIVLVGQLADLQDPLSGEPGAPVWLLTDEQVVGQTTSNRLGEFEFEYEPVRSMGLCIPVGERQLLAVSLDRRMAKRPGDS